MPENLPDGRTAQRLLLLLDQLETALKAPRNVPVSAPEDHTPPAHDADHAALTKLEAENKSLKAKQSRALAQLDSLLERLQHNDALKDATPALVQESPHEEARP
jgi:molecular chaperone GrpE (heat shock protein)